MTPKLLPAAVLMGLMLAAPAPRASAATPDEVKKAIKAGTDALSAQYTGKGNIPGAMGNGIGNTCLAGLALLEGGVPPDSPAVKNVSGLVRDAAYKQTATYQLALCLMYLDRLGDPADVPLIQLLGVRLVVWQTPTGGWGYQCGGAIPDEDEKRLRAMKATQPAGKLHPEVEKYGQWLVANRGAGATGDDNSNTQFGVLATWMARKHGVPVEDAMKRIEDRFMGTQDGRTGNWPYSGGMLGGPTTSSPSMYCAGLLGMATALARREERRAREAAPKVEPKKGELKPADPFAGAAGPPPKAAKPPAGPQDRVVQFALAGLGQVFSDQVRAGRSIHAGGPVHGVFDMYFLWSLERVGVIYGIDLIGNIDWYEVGSTALVRAQGKDGTWEGGGYGAEVTTSFAVLFLAKSNLARDLSSKVQKDPTNTEMRAGAGTGSPTPLAVRPTAPGGGALPLLEIPNPSGDEGIALASKLLKAPDADWAKLLTGTRDAKGATNTRALVAVAAYSDGDRKKEAREALAERLCRMTAGTLRGMLKAPDAELRRGAALACAMKDEKEHVPDLIEALTDADPTVGRAARAGLKSLTGKDFATADEWRAWLAKEKK